MGRFATSCEFSEGHVLRLWDFCALLTYRAEIVQGPERKELLSLAKQVSWDVEKYLGQKPSSFKELKSILQEKKACAHAADNNIH